VRHKKPLTDEEWERVFKARCASKSGCRELSKEEKELCYRAYLVDGKRYAEMDIDVFNATVPFGSNARRNR
jgi:hypothetical protein